MWIALASRSGYNKFPQTCWLKTCAFFHSGGVQRSESKVLVPSEDSKDGPVPLFYCWWLLTILGVPQLPDTSLQSLPLSPHGLLPVSMHFLFCLL